jgi:protein MpaA
MRMLRRHVLQFVARGAILTVGGVLSSFPRAGYAARTTVAFSTARYGTSREQRPLVDYSLGAAPVNVLIIGGIHAGTEANTVTLVDELIAATWADSSLAPPGVNLTFLSSANPDGLANGTRGLANGVDPNRNWPTDDWCEDTYASGPSLVVGGGGPSPLSEPETQALAALVGQTHPALIISYHSAAGLVTGGPIARAMGLETIYADVAGYDAGDWNAYPVTGDFAQWAEQLQHIPTIEIELPDHESSDVESNLAALRVTLSSFASVIGIQ